MKLQKHCTAISVSLKNRARHGTGSFAWNSQLQLAEQLSILLVCLSGVSCPWLSAPIQPGTTHRSYCWNFFTGSQQFCPSINQFYLLRSKRGWWSLGVAVTYLALAWPENEVTDGNIHSVQYLRHLFLPGLVYAMECRYQYHQQDDRYPCRKGW